MSPGPADLEHLEDRVIEIVTTHRKLTPGQVTIDSTFAELSVDSLAGAELVFEFEEAFDLMIPDDVARQITTVRQAVEALRQALTAPASSPPPTEPV
jgi:acyl carrier protein